MVGQVLNSNNKQMQQRVIQLMREFCQIGYLFSLRQVIWFNLLDVPSMLEQERLYLKDLGIYKLNLGKSEYVQLFNIILGSHYSEAQTTTQSIPFQNQKQGSSEQSKKPESRQTVQSQGKQIGHSQEKSKHIQ